jgi:hypothetical protein
MENGLGSNVHPHFSSIFLFNNPRQISRFYPQKKVNLIPQMSSILNICSSILILHSSEFSNSNLKVVKNA